ncbi:MAG: serine/threonine-protein kinase [Longimicrobiaceae bacterium]
MSNCTEELKRRLPGTVLDAKYRLEEAVDSGGMGVVFRARDERLKRPVAVKVMCLEDGTDPKRHRERFHREARLAASIKDRTNVVMVHDFGTDRDPETGHDLDYIVMELLEGEDLAAWRLRHPDLCRANLPLAVDILTQAARGVAAGHRVGIVHRDVKPRNLFLEPDGSSRLVVRVVDFGIAKWHANPAENGDITFPGAFMGSERYASPEQLRRDKNLGPQSDVFSLGVVGYELLTGTHPFTDEDRTRLSQGLPVRVRYPGALNSRIPRALKSVLRRCLEVEPEKRFPDAVELARALEAAWRSAPASGDTHTWNEPGDSIEEDRTLIQPQPAPADPTPMPAPGPDPAPPRAHGPAVPLVDPGAAQHPEPEPEDRRKNPVSPRPDRWKPGPRTVALAAGIAGLIALGGWTSLRQGWVGSAYRLWTPSLWMDRSQPGLLGRGDSTLNANERFDVYRFQSRSRDKVRLVLTLEDAGFNGVLEWGRVVGGAWKTLESSAGEHPARVYVTVADSMQYRLRVRARTPGTGGRYTLHTTRGMPVISAGEPVTGRLGAADVHLAGSDAVYYEAWTFHATAGQQVNVSLDTRDWRGGLEWLRRVNGGWEKVEAIRSERRGDDLQLTATPAVSGDYVVQVRNRDTGRSGGYTLRLTTGARELRPGAPASSKLSDADAGYGGDLPGELWLYRGAPGAPVTLSMKNHPPTAVLEWGHFNAGRWETLGSDTSALRVKPPATGEYFVHVRGSAPADTGRYTLSATTEGPPVGTITAGMYVTGTLDGSRGQTGGRPSQEWSYRGAPGGEIQVAASMQSPLVLTFGCWNAMGTWEKLASNENDPMLGQAIVARVGDTGECTIRVESIFPPPAPQSYMLTVTAVVALAPPM